MTLRLQYGATAKIFHWLVVALLMIQFPIGWLMPDIHRGMMPGEAMMFHVSFGLTILALIAARMVWRVTHPVAPESSLPPWQRLTSESVHWLLYALVLATTLTGWLMASQRGWTLSYFHLIPMPVAPAFATARTIGQWHETAELALIVVIGIHVTAAIVHVFVYRDGVMRRMLRN
ncbi:MAG: Cytochrome [Tardiphaga sp.]|nr:Cytochrome [Tardiphaga sp.]